MNRHLMIAVTLLLASGAAAAESLPLRSVNRANEVIDAAIEAHGGAEALQGLKTLSQRQVLTTFAVGQSRSPGPPYDQGRLQNFSAIDLEHQIFVNRNNGEGGGFIFDQGVIINGPDSWQLNYRSGTAAPLAEPDFHARSGPFIRVNPPLLIRQLQARRQTSHWLGEAEVGGRMHDVITLVMETGPGLSLYFDRESRLLTRMERVLPPFGQVEYEFLDYERVSGIAFNRSFRLYINGEDNLVSDNVETRVNAPLDEYLEIPPVLERVEAVRPDDFGSREIEHGVFLVGGNGNHALFVEMADHVIAIGGTQAVAPGIEEIRKVMPDKPIRYGVLTHHHSDHVPGAAAYAGEGATIVVSAGHQDVVGGAAGTDSSELKVVDHHLVLGDGKRTVELYDIGPTPHAEHVLVAYLPAEGILFEADHFPQPATGVIPPASPVTVAFAAAVERLGLNYRKLVGAHSPRIAGPEDLQQALHRKPAPGAFNGY